MKRDEVLVMKAEKKATSATIHDLNGLLAMYTGVFDAPNAFKNPSEYKEYLEACINRVLQGENPKIVKQEVNSNSFNFLKKELSHE